MLVYCRAPLLPRSSNCHHPATVPPPRSAARNILEKLFWKTGDYLSIPALHHHHVAGAAAVGCKEIRHSPTSLQTRPRCGLGIINSHCCSLKKTHKYPASSSLPLPPARHNSTRRAPGETYVLMRNIRLLVWYESGAKIYLKPVCW